MKKIYVLTLMLAMSTFSCNAMAEDNIAVVVNGQSVDFSGDQAPIIQNGRTLVPFRAVFEQMGAEVEWFNDIQLCETSYGGVTVGIVIGSNVVSLGDGAEIESDVPAQIINGRTMVPLRVLSESIGAKVDWDNSSRTVTITTPDTSAQAPESVDYTTASSSAKNDNTGLVINYEYPVISNQYAMADTLNNNIKQGIALVAEQRANTYEGDSKSLAVKYEVINNVGGIFAVQYTVEGEMLCEAGYGIINGAKIDEETLSQLIGAEKPQNTADNEGLSYTIEQYSVNQKASDGANYIIADVEYPVFKGGAIYISGLNTQLQNSAKKAADSFMASYNDKALEIYNNPPTHLFEPPYILYMSSEVEILDNVIKITNNWTEYIYSEEDNSYTDVIKIDMATGEVIEDSAI